MSAGVDLSQFYETFFDEADELLADMEQILLNVDIDQPDPDQLNAIFRAAHSIKGGAGTFGCFGLLAETTHLLENLLDSIRQGELALRKDMIDLFLETKDVLTEQVAAYRDSLQPDQEAYERICAQLRELALEHKGELPPVQQVSVPVVNAIKDTTAQQATAPASKASGESLFAVHLERVQPKDAEALLAEMRLLGEVLRHEPGPESLSVWLRTTCSADDLEAVCCFIVNQDQIRIAPDDSAQGEAEAAPPAPDADLAASAVAAGSSANASSELASPPQTSAAREQPPPVKADSARKPVKESGTLRVGVEKVDQIINLVGELVITQAMLVQTASTLDPVEHDRLLNGIEQLERNARDLQESVMSIRMMPMDYVFSRFPRVVRESASRLGKQIKLTTRGQATELDKSLIERIIDPLTHLVRNSLDHGIETPEKRVEAGKNPEGHLTLSAQHSGGQIIIEVSDDGAGLNRDRILAKAIQQGFPVNENTPDDELWQLIFAPGFSTADKVTDISGRGVGMDVVRRNIQGMGGHIQLSSRAGQGTTTRIVLPLTLAILDGMTVQAGDEVFILPLSNVSESIQPTEDQLHSISEGDNVLHVRGEYLPLIALHEVFDVEGAQTEITRSIAVILQAEESRFALLVDHLVGQQQVVVKNLEANYRKIPGISAATILGDGSVALIVDVFALLRMTRNRPAVPATSFIGDKQHA